ncbi:hypothetical protein CAPTEDRAFT_209295 [Capitella teleta]|uniref:Uncharacterized protein n=1 Tax=Capitella teleta TaxID=283909 RepID=R7VH97_CAPTE|nr:hypothetical protein CAPTEDRAFT_209295 [Capitella teleta]|eukprot:ELU17999.1 hypothetical protein CAPTEDRAFT_209295 [Capitella teleta]
MADARANPSSQEEGERLQVIRTAERILHEHRSKQRETFKKQEPSRAKRLPPGTFVSVRVLNARKGELRWQPGYQDSTNKQHGRLLRPLLSEEKSRQCDKQTASDLTGITDNIDISYRDSH